MLMMIMIAIMAIVVVLMVMAASSDRAALPHRSLGRIAHVDVVVRGHGFPFLPFRLVLLGIFSRFHLPPTSKNVYRARSIIG
jgi:hypothetical protein